MKEHITKMRIITNKDEKQTTCQQSNQNDNQMKLCKDVMCSAVSFNSRRQSIDRL